jgi:hypothetical protein
MTGIDRELSPAEFSLRWQARAIAAQLLAPGLDPQCSVKMLNAAYLDPIMTAQLKVTLAEHWAQNTTKAESDSPGAPGLAFCGWCGATSPPGGLEDDSLPLTADDRGVVDPAAAWANAEWFCADLDGCVDRRRTRYPDAEVPADMTSQLKLAKAAAAPAVLALAAVQGALAVQAAQEQRLALTGPRFDALPRPAPLSGAAYRAAMHGHTLTSPANRRHLLSRAR